MESSELSRVSESLQPQNTANSLVLADESKTCMRLLGVETVDSLGPHNVCSLVPRRQLLTAQVNTRAVEQQIYDGPSGLRPVRNAFRAKL